METNRWIRDTVAREGILLLDLEMVFADQQGVRNKESAQQDAAISLSEGTPP